MRTNDDTPEQKKEDTISIETLLKYFLLIVLGFVISQVFFTNKETILKTNEREGTEVRLKEQYQYINPLLECESNIGGEFIPDSLKSEINSYIESKEHDRTITEASIYFRDLNNGPWLGIKEKELFTPASLVKVPMMMLYFKKAETNQNILNTKLTVDDKTYEMYKDQITEPAMKLKSNTEYTIQELIEHMIYYSDNVAYTLLKNNLKEYELTKLFLDFGIDINSRMKDPNENILSVREYASFFRILYNSSYLDREYSEKALELLSSTDYDKGLVSGVTKDTKVAHKFGERMLLDQRQLHDCGIIYKAENPYLLCVMTRGTDFDKLSNVIKDITTMVDRYRK